MFRVKPVGEDIAAAIAAIPADFLAAFAELRAALEVSPWTVGDPYNPANPGGSRAAIFGPDGRGLAVFVVEDSDRRTVWLCTVIVTPDVEA